MVHMAEVLSHMMQHTRWQVFGACASPDPQQIRLWDSVFFDYMGRPRIEPLSKAFCDTCPVRKLCLEYAIVHDEQFGVWGGLTYEERLRSYPGIRMPLVYQAADEGWLLLERLSEADKILVQQYLNPPETVEVVPILFPKVAEFRFPAPTLPPPREFSWHKELTSSVLMAG